MPPNPVFETSRILLRPFNPEDSFDLHAYLSHPDLAGCRYIPRKFEQTLPFPLQDAEEIIKTWYENKDDYVFAIILKDEDLIIGHVQSDRSWDPHMSGASVVISPPFQRKGFGTEAIALMLNYLFNFTVAHNISVAIEDWNTPAQLFATHLGFQPVGKRQQIIYKNGRFHDDLVFDILKPEWKEASHAADR